ncbi:hypothetical protein PPERSA_00909 [Pseudocohnilembus persalinus]|uniref:Uncharacterized protein n=1 Tax=Pseudocohnilembus persalinus TaxID=266149 RepID=A0A0V0QEN0_PSEPJ|nr:hypothetical protein PPERSA_00909 [Pseudocohnilembus persalinus]|eukprot:KRX00682.1 hypothetical protein PPERSA_00909 [Pseudocohnilembus persalinus]
MDPSQFFPANETRRKISKQEFQERVQQLSNMKMEDMNAEIEILNKDQRMELRKTVLKKFTTQFSTLEQEDKSLCKQFVFNQFRNTFIGVGLYTMAKQNEIFGFKPQKFILTRIIGLKYGIGVFIPITLLAFKDFLYVTFKVGLKYRYIEENMKFLE